MIVDHTMRWEGELQAVDRMIRLTRELDRYHGLAQAPALPKPRQRGSHSRRNSTRAEEATCEIFPLATP
jgi:hypothetical protein